MNREKSFLGTGWSFPPTFNRHSGDVQLVSDRQDIRQSLLIYLNTQRGERLMRLKYGSVISDHIFDSTRSALKNAGARTATCHLSHSYTDGACLYFTFAARPDDSLADFERLYRALWDAGTRAVLADGGNLSHHPGIGLNRATYVREGLGSGLDVLNAIKRALDPHGILNPGKMGLDDDFSD